MTDAEIIAKATITDFMGTRPDYVEIAIVRQHSPALADKIQAERDAYAARDPFEGTIFASPEHYA